MHPRTCFLFLSICLFSTVHAAHVNSKNLREIFIRSFDSPSRKPEIDLTCFTCQKSSTNEICNLNAIDESCSQTNNKASPQIRSVFRQEPENFAGCMTIHRFNVVTQETIYIEKKCVKECSSSMVGCQALVTDNDIQVSIFEIKPFEKSDSFYSSNFIIVDLFILLQPKLL